MFFLLGCCVVASAIHSTQELESIAKIDMFLLMFNIVKDVCLQFCASLCVFFSALQDLSCL